MEPMSRAKIARILRKNRGAIRDLAKDLEVSHAAVSLWLSGKTKSDRIAAAAELRARVLEEEAMCLKATA